MEYTDRYGGYVPDVNTVCKGPCEGLGVYPLVSDDKQEATIVVCPICGGTGTRAQQSAKPASASKATRLLKSGGFNHVKRVGGG